jgi:asparagine synthase (glutamine-hydrolysing)
MIGRLTSHVKQALIGQGLSPTARAVRARHLTYLSPERLRALERSAQAVNRRQVRGDFVETGVALGGSAILLATLMGPDRRFRGYDVFGTIPPPSDRDPPEVHQRYDIISSGQSNGIRGDVYYGYRQDLLGEVTQALGNFGLPLGDRVRLYRGLFENTLQLDHPVALAHIDCDWYDAVITCLTRIAPLLSRGGFMVLDDYHDWGGCRDATNKFLAGNADFALVSLGSTVAIEHSRCPRPVEKKASRRRETRPPAISRLFTKPGQLSRTATVTLWASWHGASRGLATCRRRRLVGPAMP